MGLLLYLHSKLDLKTSKSLGEITVCRAMVLALKFPQQLLTAYEYPNHIPCPLIINKEITNRRD